MNEARGSDDELRELAARLLQAGRVPEAIAAHERLLARQPDYAAGWYNLAYLLHRAQRHEAALVAYRRALDHGIDAPEEVHLNRAAILAEHLARPDEAERELDAALRLNPRHVPALVNLGALHEQRGERERAVDAYERALAIEPEQPLALARLPALQRPRDAADPLIARLRAALARPGLAPLDRADLGFGLGRALDAVGAFDEAFAAYAEANRAGKLSAGPGAPRYDPAAHEALVDRLIRAFARPVPAGDGPPADTTPIFVCGMYRSGSTLVEQILASHPRVTAGGEIGLLPAIARRVLVPAGDALAPLDPPRLHRLRAEYLGGVRTLHPHADRLTDKRPDNFLYIGLIKTLFPDARIVHTRRHPLDNCLSVYFLQLDPGTAYAHELADIAHWYRQYRRLMAHWKSLYGEAIHDVDYDALVAGLEPAVARLLAYCGLPWDEACLRFHETRTVVATPSAWQVREPLYARASGRWRHYDRHLAALRAALGPDAA